jgi:hypothetical protein
MIAMSRFSVAPASAYMFAIGLFAMGGMGAARADTQAPVAALADGGVVPDAAGGEQGPMAPLYQLLNRGVQDSIGDPLGTVADITLNADTLMPQKVVVALEDPGAPIRLVAIDARDFTTAPDHRLSARIDRGHAARLPVFRYDDSVSSLRRSTDLGDE